MTTDAAVKAHDAARVETVARAIFDSLKGDVHCTEWDFGKGPQNIDDETKERYRKMARAAILSQWREACDRAAKIADLHSKTFDLHSARAAADRNFEDSIAYANRSLAAARVATSIRAGAEGEGET